MKGQRATCSICGAEGEKYGCPSWFDVCVDREACLSRVVYARNLRIQQLEEQLAERTRESSSDEHIPPVA